MSAPQCPFLRPQLGRSWLWGRERRKAISDDPQILAMYLGGWWCYLPELGRPVDWGHSRTQWLSWKKVLEYVLLASSFLFWMFSVNTDYSSMQSTLQMEIWQGIKKAIKTKSAWCYNSSCRHWVSRGKNVELYITTLLYDQKQPFWSHLFLKIWNHLNFQQDTGCPENKLTQIS